MAYTKQASVLAVVISLCAAGVAHADTRLTIGSTSSSSSHYGYFVAVSQIINENVDGVRSSVMETGATIDNLRRIKRNQADMGLVTTNVAYDAYHGEGAFEGNEVPTNVLWVYGPSAQNVVVRADAGLNTISDLEGVKFNPGIVGSGTEATAEAVFDVIGVTPDYVRGSTTDMVNQIKDNRVKGYVKSGNGRMLDASSIDIATMTPVNILGLSDEQADAIRQELPSLGIMNIEENEAGDDYPAYTTWAYGNTVSSRADLDEEVAYNIVKAIVEHQDAQAAAFSVLKDADIPEMTIELATTPLHPGAIRYFEEQGYEVPEHLKP
ncbi:TAXI family TRAP transporter solute-binding subunit [Vreelandella titanicae]|uniref:TAXI family TRAP transporter solute-binding subunit n=1 Tax=Vreelandella titanicae TaxID=664683 RepID=UPI0039BFB1BD|tara:strand:+ start:4176 stop:5144 length:969 start_codon:yes stop_codon:yes gene_type:complete